MTVSDLDKGEKFKFNNRIFTKGNVVEKPKSNYNHYIFDCFDDGMRHRPFRDDVEIEPLQRRIKQ